MTYTNQQLEEYHLAAYGLSQQEWRTLRLDPRGSNRVGCKEDVIRKTVSRVCLYVAET